MKIDFRLDPFHPFHLGFVAKPNAPGRSDAELDGRRSTCEVFLKPRHGFLVLALSVLSNFQLMVLGFEMIEVQIPLGYLGDQENDKPRYLGSLVRIAISPVAVARTSAKASVASKCSRIAQASVTEHRSRVREAALFAGEPSAETSRNWKKKEYKLKLIKATWNFMRTKRRIPKVKHVPSELVDRSLSIEMTDN